MNSTLSPHLVEARALQDRGFLNDASRHFDLALSEDPDNVLLILEVGGHMMKQGLLGEAHAMALPWEARIDNLRANPELLDPIHAALFDSFMAMLTYAMTVKFKEPLRRALDSYVKHGLGQLAESFGKHVVGWVQLPVHRRCC